MGSPKGRNVRLALLATGAILVVVTAGVAWRLGPAGSARRVDTLDRTVIVFASAAEDGAQVAQVVALATEGGRSVRFVDSQTLVTIPGVSETYIRDAYPFGGGAGVAKALEPVAGGRSGFVAVDEPEWVAMLGDATIDVMLPKPVDTFDGARLVSFPEGPSRVRAADIPALLRGVAYLDETARMKVIDAVGRASVGALARAASSTQASTDLTPKAYSALIGALASR